MSYVYIIAGAEQWPAEHDRIKVGASRAPRRRRSELQVSAPEKLVIVDSWRVASMFDRERFFHEAFEPWRDRGEWFRIPRNLAREIIDAFLAGEIEFFKRGLEYQRLNRAVEMNDDEPDVGFEANLHEMIQLNRARVERISTWDTLLYDARHRL